MKLINFLLLILFLSSSVYADTWKVINNPRDVWYITPVFCSERPKTSPRLDMKDVETNKDTEVCIWALNSTWELLIKMYFVDWVIWKDWKIACLASDDKKKGFAKYINFPVNPYNENDKVLDEIIVSMWSWQIIQRMASIRFPNEYEWMSYGCLITETAVKPEVALWTLWVNIRRANVIRANVKWKINIWLDSKPIRNILSLENIFGSKEDSFYVFKLNNTWNIAISYGVETNVKNIFGFTWSSFSAGVLLPWESIKIKQSIWLPFYKWLYLANTTLTYSPKFDFVSSLTWQLQKETTIKKYSRLYVFPTTLFLIWLVIFIAIFSYIYFVIIRTSKHLKKIKPHAKEYKIKKWDHISDIAEKFNCKWIDIARLNNIKSPYSLHDKEWKIILVPDFTKNKEEHKEDNLNEEFKWSLKKAKITKK